MSTIDECMAFLKAAMLPYECQDYCPNGLQVEGEGTVNHMVTGVTASLALIEAAIKKDAQLILVHHGVCWHKDAQVITGYRAQRLKALIRANVHLVAYHLPLDIHPKYGNNVQLGTKLGWDIHHVHAAQGIDGLLYEGGLPEVQTGAALATHLAQHLAHTPLHISADRPIQRIAWCTGAAAGMTEQAAALGVDAFVTGEINEAAVHVAREHGIHLFAAGHHATEKGGVCALGAEMAQSLGLTHEFIDIPNPV